MIRRAVSMSMPVKIEIAEDIQDESVFEEVFSYFDFIDNTFSTYKDTSEVSRINNMHLKSNVYSDQMKHMIALCEQTKQETNGYFDAYYNGTFDPLGIVKGYAIYEASNMILRRGYKNIYVEIAGDIQVYGKNSLASDWSIGIQNPFNTNEIIKVVSLHDKGIATSGNYERGRHIFNPRTKTPSDEIASITVIGPNVLEADRFSTPVFAMGMKGIDFIENLPGFEAYFVTNDRRGYFTRGFHTYLLSEKN